VDPRYRELTARVDAFVDRVTARHGADLQCRPGCEGCCHQRLTVAAVEAEAIEAWAATLVPEAREAIAAAAREASEAREADAHDALDAHEHDHDHAHGGDGRCAALDGDGRCRIYAARPLVCRSHGIPVRLRRRGLPVVTACELNFTARGPAAADPDCVLDQELVSTPLGLIERAAAQAAGAPDGQRPRRALADVLAGLPAAAARLTS
jgi:Fe-S-cluster containining protein